MCERWVTRKPCPDYRCPHNLFWEGLSLDGRKIHLTDKALAIGNCCCLVDEPWTLQEIGEVWGLTRERIRQYEAKALRKVQKKNGRGLLLKTIVS